MPKKRLKAPRYTPEFIEKAVDMVMASAVPDKEVAKLLGINSSTLATWKGKRLRMTGPQPQKTLSLEVNLDDQIVISDSNSEMAPEMAPDIPLPVETTLPDQKQQILDDVAGLIPEEVEHIRKENVKLKNERDVLQEAIIILAGSYLRA